MYRKNYNPTHVERSSRKLAVRSHEEYRKQIDPGFVDPDGRTNLHLALMQGSDYYQLVEDLIKAGCNVNAHDKNGRLPIHMAAQKGYVRCATELIQHKSKIDVFNEDGLCPLMLVARHSHPELLQVLINAGAIVNLHNDKHETPLHYAVGGGNLECVRILLDAKAKINYTDDDGNTPLILAAKLSNHSILALLVKSRAKLNAVDSTGKTALHWTAECGDVKCAQTLIKSSADINLADKNSITPFVRCLKCNQPKVLEVLLAAGCDKSTIDGLMGTPLALAAIRGNKECVEILLRDGEDPNELGFFGMTPLMSASFESKVDVVDVLLRMGADPNVLGRSGFTPLIMALIKVSTSNDGPRHKIIGKLLRANADPNYRVTRAGYYTCATNGRNCALSMAIVTGYHSLLRMLLIAGSQVTCEELNEWMNIEKTNRFFDVNELMDPIRQWKEQPVSLKHSCRCIIRKCLGRRPVSKITRLPIAPKLKSYLDYEEFDYLTIERAHIKQETSIGMMDFVKVTPCGLRALEGTLLHDSVRHDSTSICHCPSCVRSSGLPGSSYTLTAGKTF